MNTGAWFVVYQKGLAGTLGESLDLADRDNLGWALRSWKYELDYNGYRGAMVLDTPALGDAASTEIRAFQAEHGLSADGIIGPATARQLLGKRIRGVASSYGVAYAALDGIVAHESGYDLGAIGSVDNGDRGLTQQHIYPAGSITLSQAIRPASALPRLAAQLKRLAWEWDEDSAIASWNIGEGGAEWWWKQGKPASGSPPWWTFGDLAARATAYVATVRKLA